MLASGRSTWSVGERVRVYRATGGRAAIATDPDAEDDGGVEARSSSPAAEPRDYDVEWYLRVMRTTFAARLSTGLDPEDFQEVFADPEQPSLFAARLEDARPVLNST